jgi:preprotein translocase subunit SecF
MELIRPDINIDFVGKRKYAYLLSLTLMILSLVGLVWRGNSLYGIDFAGGTVIQVSFAQPTDAGKIREGLKEIGLERSAIQRFGAEGENNYLIRTDLSGPEHGNLQDRVKESLERVFGKGGVTVERVEMVGPKVGQDLRQNALLAIFYATLFIAVYISGRFELKWLPPVIMTGALILGVYTLRVVGMHIPMLILSALLITTALCWTLKLKYALGAVVATIHDVIITAGAVALTGKEFDLTVVAAILTITGYSLNDTIIVFDRIRENVRKVRRRDFAELVNGSINQVLTRTLLTSGTTLATVLALFFLGGAVIHDFAYTLMVGIIVGTYSSSFVASPVLIEWETRFGKIRAMPTKKQGNSQGRK